MNRYAFTWWAVFTSARGEGLGIVKSYRAAERASEPFADSATRAMMKRIRTARA